MATRGCSQASKQGFQLMSTTKITIRHHKHNIHSYDVCFISGILWLQIIFSNLTRVPRKKNYLMKPMWKTSGFFFNKINIKPLIFSFKFLTLNWCIKINLTFTSFAFLLCIQKKFLSRSFYWQFQINIKLHWINFAV